MCGPVKLSHLPVAGRCDRIDVKVLPLHILPQTPQIWHRATIEPTPHKWEASLLTTALSLLPLTYLLNTSSNDSHDKTKYSAKKLDISSDTEQTFAKLTLFPQITNLVFSYQFSDESQRHYIHNGHAKSHYYDWCIGGLPDGGSLKIIPNGTAYHKGSCQKVTPLQEQTKCRVERKKLYRLDTFFFIIST